MSERAASQSPRTEGESVRTFLIADVRGYTHFTLEHGDEAAGRLAQRFAAIVDEVVSLHGGTVIELRGDEALAVFSSSRSALRTAVELQARFSRESTAELPLRVGVGLDAGEAVRVGEGFRGAALNLAARLCSIAQPGQILASEGVAHLARRVEGVQYRDREPVRLKGFSDPVRLVEVVPAAVLPETPAAPWDAGASPGVQELPVGGFLGSLPASGLAGRQAELERLQGIVETVFGGQGRLVLLAGEPGIGKTRLAQEITAHLHDRGCIVAAGRCYEPQEAVAYYPFLEALTTLFAAAPADIRAEAGSRWPYLGQLLPDHVPVHPVASGTPDEQQRLFRAVTAFLQTVAAQTPVALLLDDLHWADQSSLDLLQYIARHTHGDRVFILATYRDVEVGRQHPLGRALRDLHREGLGEEIALRRLDRQDTAALIARTFGEAGISDEFAGLVYRHTEGNPFFTQEVLRALVERGDVYRDGDRWERREIAEIEVPRSVRDAIGERLSHLPEDAQTLLREAAVLGQTFGFDDLEAMTERSEDEVEAALDAAVGAALIRPAESESYAFSHALIHGVLYGELSPRRRRRLHLRAGEALEKLPPRRRGSRAAELAWHFIQADEPERALPYAMQAGDAAAQVYAHAEAARHYRLALELLEDAPDGRREAEALGKLGAVLARMGQNLESLESLERAAALFRALDDRAGECGLVPSYGPAYRGAGRADEGIAVIRDLLWRVEGEADAATLATLFNMLEFLCFGSGRYTEGLEAAERASAYARQSGDEALLFSAEVSRGTELGMCGRMAEGTHVLEEALALGSRMRTFDAQYGRALINVANSYIFYGRIADAERAFEECLSLYEGTGNVLGTVMVLSNLGSMAAMRGDYAVAHGLLERAIALSDTLTGPWWRSYPLLELGRLQIVEGRWREAVDTLQRPLAPARESGDLQAIRYACAHLAEAYLNLGKPVEARALLVPLADPDRFGEKYVPDLWVALANVYVCLGEPEEASRLLDDVIAAPPDSVERYVLADGMLARSRLARLQGRATDALPDADRALAIARDIGCPHLEASALLERGLVQRALGNRDAAGADLQRSLEIFETLGAEPWADIVRAAMHEAADRMPGDA